MKVKREIAKIMKTSQPVEIKNPNAILYRDHAKEAQAFYTFSKKLSGCHEQLTWKDLRSVYLNMDFILKEAVHNFLSSLRQEVTIDGPVTQHIWEERVEESLAFFNKIKVVYFYIVQKLHVKYPKEQETSPIQFKQEKTKPVKKRIISTGRLVKLVKKK